MGSGHQIRRPSRCSAYMLRGCPTGALPAISGSARIREWKS
jgi:hypothetical protein